MLYHSEVLLLGRAIHLPPTLRLEEGEFWLKFVKREVKVKKYKD